MRQIEKHYFRNILSPLQFSVLQKNSHIDYSDRVLRPNQRLFPEKYTKIDQIFSLLKIIERNEYDKSEIQKFS